MFPALPRLLEESDMLFLVNGPSLPLDPEGWLAETDQGYGAGSTRELLVILEF